MLTTSPVPRVSLLMTVYNAADYLRAAIDSVVAQSFADWELVVVDDGSTDASAAILGSYEDPRIHVTLLPHNIGRTPALRQAFEMARGEYLAVLDADDLARADRLAKQVAYLDVHPDVLLVGSWVRYIDERGNVIGRCRPPTDPVEVKEFLAWGNPIAHSSAMYRAAVAADVGGYSLEFKYAQDFGLWLRLAARGSIGLVAEELCDQRIVTESMTRGARFRVDMARDGVNLSRAAGQLLALRGRAARRNRDAVTLAEIKWGLALMQGGSLFAGTATIAGAVAHNPFSLLRSRSYRRRHLQ